MIKTAASIEAAKALLTRLQALQSAQVAETGCADLEPLASLICEAFENPAQRRELAIGLAEYLSSALDGSVIDLEDWLPAWAADTSHAPS